ncbi:MAG: carotenoid biosynthesis protein [Chitinophagales bacterium]
MLFLSIFYVVGIIGLLNDATSKLFQQLTPFNILLSVVVLFCFHHPWNRSAVLSMLAVAIAGFTIEMFGVHSGKIFGSYEYGDSLGWKISNTPLIIGLNWLLLVYITNLAMKQIGIGKPWIELTAAALMTALDYLIEPVAVQYDFWHWKEEIIPIQNFVAWFYISFIMQLSFNRAKPVKENKMAIPLVLLQILFFIALNIWK